MDTSAPLFFLLPYSSDQFSLAKVLKCLHEVALLALGPVCTALMVAIGSPALRSLATLYSQLVLWGLLSEEAVLEILPVLCPVHPVAKPQLTLPPWQTIGMCYAPDQQ